MEELTQRLHRLLRLIDDAPVARTTSEETMRQWLLRCVASSCGKRGLNNDNTAMSARWKLTNPSWTLWKNVSVDPPPSRKT
jgi:hypothetical protein